MALIAAGLSAATSAQGPADGSIYGVWWGHHQNVKVETRACGTELCGTVVWATPDAQKTAKEDGTDPLLGLEVFRHYHQTQAGEWEGEVFVPGMRRSFASRIQQVGGDKLRIGGCILDGLICKYQIWRRV